MEKFKVDFWIEESYGRYYYETFEVIVVPRKNDLIEIKFDKLQQELIYKVKSVKINVNTNNISVELQDVAQ